MNKVVRPRFLAWAGITAALCILGGFALLQALPRPPAARSGAEQTIGLDKYQILWAQSSDGASVTTLYAIVHCGRFSQWSLAAEQMSFKIRLPSFYCSQLPRPAAGPASDKIQYGVRPLPDVASTNLCGHMYWIGLQGEVVDITGRLTLQELRRIKSDADWDMPALPLEEFLLCVKRKSTAASGTDSGQ